MAIQTKTIVVKINDKYFLQQLTYNNNQSKIIIDSNFFLVNNQNRIYTLYPNINRNTGTTNSESVFNGLITALNNLVQLNSSLTNLKLESLFRIIFATSVVDLMQKAKSRTNFIGENLLNYYYFDVKIEAPATLMMIVDKFKKLPGVDYVYVRGELSHFEIPTRSTFSGEIDKIDRIKGIAIEIKDKFTPIENLPKPLQSEEKKSELDSEDDNKNEHRISVTMGKFVEMKMEENTNQNVSNLPLSTSINEKINSLFDYCKVPLKKEDKYIKVNKSITVVDFERGWNNIQNDSNYSNIMNSIFGGGHNHGSYKAHGQKTLNILIGQKNTNTANQIDGLCKGVTVKLASAWFGSSVAQKQTESALVKTLVNSSILAGDIVLLEVQIDRWNLSNLPVEIESAMYAVIKAGVQAGYILIEAAGNHGHNTNTLTPSNINQTSQTTTTMITENPPVNLSQNNLGTGSIVVGGRKTDSRIDNTNLNHGNRVDYYCFSESSFISSSTITNGITFSATSMASAITAALTGRFQSEAIKSLSNGGIGRRLTITEIKRLLASIPYPDTPPTNLPTPTSFQHFLSSRGIPNVLPQPLSPLAP